MVKLAVIYYSATGHGTRMAQVIEQAAQAAGAEVRVRHIAETNPVERFQDNPAWKGNYDATKDLPAATADDLVWADAVILGSPTRFSNVAAPFQAFLDSLGGVWSQGKLADKVYAAYTSSNTLHGGQETTLQKIYQVVQHFGGIIVAPGFTADSKFVDGNPYGVSFVTGADNQNELDETTRTALEHMTRRVLDITAKLVG